MIFSNFFIWMYRIKAFLKHSLNIIFVETQNWCGNHRRIHTLKCNANRTHDPNAANSELLTNSMVGKLQKTTSWISVMVDWARKLHGIIYILYTSTISCVYVYKYIYIWIVVMWNDRRRAHVSSAPISPSSSFFFFNKTIKFNFRL